VTFACPYCHTGRPPMQKSRISTGGWVLFVLLLLACFPLCWLGFFCRERFRVCRACGIKLG
jgi:hypothetical protein